MAVNDIDYIVRRKANRSLEKRHGCVHYSADSSLNFTVRRGFNKNFTLQTLCKFWEAKYVRKENMDPIKKLEIAWVTPSAA